MSTVYFVNRFFFPDLSATSQILSDLAFGLAAEGASVHVITSMQRYEHADSVLPAHESINNVRVTRVRTTSFGRASLPGRAIDYLSFYFLAWRALRAKLKPQDTVVAMTDPPLLSVVAMLAARKSDAHLINWLQDLYPEVAINLGVPFLRGPLGRLLCALRDRSLRAARANVVLGTVMAEKLHELGCPANVVRIIHNWSDDEEIAPTSPSENPLRRDWQLLDKFVIGYSGNLGRAHEFQTVLEASELLRNNRKVIFVMIGSGHQMQEFARSVRARQLDELYRFYPYQPRSSLALSLSAPDIHWLSLRPEMEGLIVPSKFYGIAAAGRGTLAVTASDGEIARLVQQHQCGVVIQPGDARGLAEAIERLASDRDCVTKMGLNARVMLDAGLRKRDAIQHWAALLDTPFAPREPAEPTSINKPRIRYP